MKISIKLFLTIAVAFSAVQNGKAEFLGGILNPITDLLTSVTNIVTGLLNAVAALIDSVLKGWGPQNVEAFMLKLMAAYKDANVKLITALKDSLDNLIGKTSGDVKTALSYLKIKLNAILCQLNSAFDIVDLYLRSLGLSKYKLTELEKCKPKVAALTDFFTKGPLQLELTNVANAIKPLADAIKAGNTDLPTMLALLFPLEDSISKADGYAPEFFNDAAGLIVDLLNCLVPQP